MVDSQIKQTDFKRLKRLQTSSERFRTNDMWLVRVFFRRWVKSRDWSIAQQEGKEI